MEFNRRTTVGIFYKFFLCFILLTPFNSYSAAWTTPEGEGLIIANVQQYTSKKYWDKGGHLKNSPTYNQFSVNPYIEYGARHWLTIGVNPFFYRIHQLNATSDFAINNITPFVRALLKEDDWSATSVQIGFNQPFKSANFSTTPLPNSQYGIINRQRFLDIRFLYGTGGPLNKEKSNTWYADAEIAYRPNFNGAAAEIHIDFMMGIELFDERLVFEVKELNTIGLHNPKSITQLDYNLFTVVASAQYWFTKRWGLEAGMQQDFYGTNIGMGSSPFIAAWFKF